SGSSRARDSATRVDPPHRPREPRRAVPRMTIEPTGSPTPAGVAGQPASSWETSYRVRFDEAGPDGRLRTSGFMRYAQDLAWQHSAELGFGRAWYAERGLTWLVRAAELMIVASPEMGSTVGARTAIVGIRRVFARRRGEFLQAD